MTDTQIPEGMKPWNGGDGPPADWDGVGVAFRRGGMVTDRGWRWAHRGNAVDIIAYTPKPPAYPEGMTPELWGQVLECLTAVSRMSGTKQADKARAIMVKLEPVDPDLELAREIANDHSFSSSGAAVEAILAAIKRVRAEASQ